MKRTKKTIHNHAIIHNKTLYYLQMSVDSLELLLSLCCLPVGLAQLDLHLIEISLHLLLQPESLVSAASLSLQGALQSVQHSLMVTFGLLHLLILLCQFALNVSLHLIELKLNSEDLTFLMLKGTLLRNSKSFDFF